MVYTNSKASDSLNLGHSILITVAGNIYYLLIPCQVLYLFALSYYFIRSLQLLYKLDIIIISAAEEIWLREVKIFALGLTATG